MKPPQATYCAEWEIMKTNVASTHAGSINIENKYMAVPCRVDPCVK